MGPQEIRALLDGLDGVDLGAHCPHGRPVVLKYSLKDIQRAFKRI